MILIEPTILIEDYLLTCFVKYYIKGEPAAILDILRKFSVNPYYDSKVPILRSGLSDMFLKVDRKYDYKYNCPICDELLIQDRYSIQGRVAFYELMRICLPSYSIILEDEKEIEVQAFLSVYNDGYCGITHIYPNILIPFSKNTSNYLELSDEVKYIKLDKLFIDILNITSDSLDLNAEYDKILISKQDFISITEGDPFNVHKEIIFKILSINMFTDNKIDEDDVESMNNTDVFRVYNLSNDSILNNHEIEKIRTIVEGLDELCKFNCNVMPKLLDLSGDYKELILLSYNYLLFIKEPEYEGNNRNFIPVYATVEYFLNERCKLYEAQDELKNLDLSRDITQENLIIFRDKYLKSIKIDVGYEFYIPERAQAAEHIKETLRINFLYGEMKKTFEENFRATRLNAEIEEKKIQIQEKNKEYKFNKSIQLFTLMLTIPVVTQLVDILYIIEVEKIIVFPIGLAKLIWVTIVSIIALIYFNLKKE